ncbi:MAG TPA: hypothetical protein VF785_01335, partial [Gemmatimonadaceae bacterium]
MHARMSAVWWLSTCAVGLFASACAVGEHEDAASGDVSVRDVDIAAADRSYRAAMDQPGNWVEYGRDYTNQRWSPLTQITTGNVAQLKLAWIDHSGIFHASETGPVVIDG